MEAIDTINAPAIPRRLTSSPAGETGNTPLFKRKAPMNVTEAFADLVKQQDAIKAALDELISDAMTLRAQL